MMIWDPFLSEMDRCITQSNPQDVASDLIRQILTMLYIQDLQVHRLSPKKGYIDKTKHCHPKLMICEDPDKAIAQSHAFNSE